MPALHPPAGSIDAGFAKASLDPACAIPREIAGPDARRRFGIYRNNVVLGLIDALATRFPVVRASVGEEFFHETARLYARSQPPRSPVMAQFGDTFPEFLETFPPLAEFPYLGDVARLEVAITRAYHAEDAPGLTPSALVGLGAERLLALSLAVHPAVHCIVSAHPCVTIWEMNHGLRPLDAIAPWCAEDALISRPRFEVQVSRLPPGGALLVNRMRDGAPLVEACNAAMQVPEADLAQILHALLSAGALMHAPSVLEPS